MQKCFFDFMLFGDKLDKYLFMLDIYYDDFSYWFIFKILIYMLELLIFIYIIIKYYEGDVRNYVDFVCVRDFCRLYIYL